MKELSIEEKAERYDEAIERAKKVLLDCTIDARNAVEFLHPELKESEDERTRKYIIKYFEANKDELSEGFKWNGITVEECIAWLEKQSEQKPADFDDTNAKRMFIKALERVEEQNNKGYKLTDCDKNSWWEDFKAYTSCTVEQKSAWSEKYIADVFEKVGLAKIVREQGNDNLTNALQDAMIELAKTCKYEAWSEEDEKMFNSALWHIKNSCGNGGKNSGEFEVYNWLKALKDRYTWKPSDEQLEALEGILGLINPKSMYGREIVSLLEQFKKLREE